MGLPAPPRLYFIVLMGTHTTPGSSLRWPVETLQPLLKSVPWLPLHSAHVLMGSLPEVGQGTTAGGMKMDQTRSKIIDLPP
jgi:hypothetical protein